MAKIVCEKCGTEFKYEIAKDMKNCPVCGISLLGDDNSSHGEEHPDWITWYYYGFKSDSGKSTCLDDNPIDLTEHGDTFFLIKEFKAPPESECGLDEVKRILRTYVPDAFVYPEKKEPVVICPRCFSDSFQFVPRKFSLLTGFATNKVDKMCNKCGKRF